MNKAELITAITLKTKGKKKEATENLNAIIGVITESLEKGQSVKLVGFGTFETRKRKEKLGVNPRDTKQKIKIPARTVPAFKAGKELKKKVNL